ncbi:ABC transporter substrate-binding protein [Mesorhizobium sp. LHD-90]|uniref:ABC transporter substrate-binding protein n=1 Tax=Mesorhizobium sp. LHD-90 TaxID=3071414 RepID=UPI0027E03AFB|nr:ABC transporter substrate-binding protein [Mesorhizobium sp. LHD-90]MDQ6438111.1 ABC transporter substrate-binding protein [Mesorhizobium sp. LHD-90]
MHIIPNRRRFLAGLAAAGTAGLIGAPSSARADPLPETTTVRLPRYFDDDGGCWAALGIAGELLRAEGFTVQDVQGDLSVDNSMWLAGGETDFDITMASMLMLLVDAGVPVTVLSGLHTGCFEVIANDNIRDLTDLRGKKVGVYALNDHPHVLTQLLVAYVGLDPKRDIQWVTAPGTTPTDLFIDGRIDAFLAGEPVQQHLRARKIGHSIFNNAVDRPWSQYFCCMIAGSADYVNKYPIATKHVLRAILKGADLCASDAPSAARQLVDRGYHRSYDYTLQTLNVIGYDTWRDHDAEDSMRFYGLRMQETGMIKSSPQKIIAEGTNWQILDELKRELKT